MSWLNSTSSDETRSSPVTCSVIESVREPVCFTDAQACLHHHHHHSQWSGGVSADPGVCPVTCLGVHHGRSVLRAGVEAAAARAECQESVWRGDGLGTVWAWGRGGTDRRQSPECWERGGSMALDGHGHVYAVSRNKMADAGINTNFLQEAFQVFLFLISKLNSFPSCLFHLQVSDIESKIAALSAAGSKKKVSVWGNDVKVTLTCAHSQEQIKKLSGFSC